MLRMRRPSRKLGSALLAAVLALVVAYVRRELSPPEPGVAPADSQALRLCTRVVDGDTLVLDGGERVRLIGVNSPESVDPRRPVEYFGKEAAAFTRALAEGRKVRLEYDLEKRDQYGRTLAYVYLEDGRMLNAEIIRQGYGQTYVRFPFKYRDEFLALERQARAEGRGLWAR